ncbi:MAG: hypothetical protein JW882_14980 [Deltaproteobacteria bacterium]|nr:hypothetical protein [Deltaproteobacteria bacterium]
MEEKIVYFEKPGKVNTAEVIKLVKERAQARGINRFVVASTRGATARDFLKAFTGTDFRLVIVPWQFGFKGEDQPFPPELVDELRAKNHQVHYGTMLFHTADFYGTNAPQAMANLLRTFGQGSKVCLEIILMACNGGFVSIGEKIIAVAGTRSGADTALVATAAPTTSLNSLRIHEIICKPFM